MAAGAAACCSGHEGAGAVRDIGAAVTRVAPGDRVGMTFNSCGSCPTCLQARSVYCHDLFGRKGGRAVRLRHPDRGGGLNVMRSPTGSSLVVMGIGAVGLSAVMAGVIAGCGTIVGVDIRPNRLELARELGATHVIDANTAGLGEEIRRITGVGADYAVETTGVPAVLRTAVDALAPTGECGGVGAPPLGAEVALDVNGVLALGRVVRRIVEGESVPELFLPTLLDLWRQGRVPVDRMMVSYDSDRIEDAACDAEAGATIKRVPLM